MDNSDIESSYSISIDKVATNYADHRYGKAIKGTKMTDLFTEKHTLRAVQVAGHQHCTTSAQDLIATFTENWLMEMVKKSDAIASDNLHWTILLSDVLQALSVSGLHLYDYGTMVTIGKQELHETEVLTLNYKWNIHEEYEIGKRIPSLNMEATYMKNIKEGKVDDDDDKEDNEEDIEQIDSCDDDDDDSSDDEEEEMEDVDPMIRDLRKAQQVIDGWSSVYETKDTETPFGQVDEKVDTIAASRLDDTTTLWETHGEDNSRYFQLSETVQQTQDDEVIFTRQMFAHMLYFVHGGITIPGPISGAALAALHAVFETELNMELANGVTGWKIAQDAIQWRYEDECTQREVAQAQKVSTSEELSKLETELRNVKKQLEFLQQHDDNNNETTNENDITRNGKRKMDNGTKPLSSIQSLKNTFTKVTRKRAKITPA